jgi:Zn-dependent peptidase ImmA (M78 family)
MAYRARYPKPTIPTAEGQVEQEDIERLAAETREALRLGPDGPIPHVTRALERSGIATVPLVLPAETDAETSTVPGHFGMSYWAGPGAYALVGFFPGNKPDRDRFTLGHELGHLVLHTHRRGADDPEEEANRFAGEFLMPAHRAREILTPDLTLKDFARLKAIWGMSIQALIMRALHCGCIDKARHRSLFMQLSARGWRRNEPVVMHPEEPLLTWKLLRAEFGGDSPYASAVDKLGLPPVILRSLIPQPQAGDGKPGGGGQRGGKRNRPIGSVVTLSQRA